MSRGRLVTIALGLAVVVAVTIRAAFVLRFPDMPLHGDERDFVEGARALLAGQPVPCFPFRPPLYVAFCAGALKLFGPGTDAIRFAQVALEAGTVLVLFRVGAATLGRGPGLLAAWLYALWPDAIAYSHYLWSETLGLFLLALGLLALLRLAARPGWRTALVVGLVWAASMHVKPYHAYLLPLLLGWLVFDAAGPARRATLGAAALALAVALAAITPWSLHVSLQEGTPLLLCKTGPKNLRSGVDFAPPPQFDFASEWDLTPEQRAAFPKRETGVVAFIAAHPGLFLERAFQKLGYLWSPNSYALRYLYEAFPPGRQMKYGNPRQMQRWQRMTVVWSTLGMNALLCLGLVLGAFLSRERRLTGLTAVYVLVYCAMITLTPALSRYRLPLMVFAVLHTAQLLTGHVDRGVLEGRPGRTLGLALCLGGLVLLWVQRVPGVLEQVW